MSDDEVHEISRQLAGIQQKLDSELEHAAENIEALWKSTEQIRMMLAGDQERAGILTRLALLEEASTRRGLKENAVIFALIALIVQAVWNMFAK